MNQPVELDIQGLVWTIESRNYVRRHGGSVRVCREVFGLAPLYFPQSGRTATHKMIGPDLSGRMWTVPIKYRGNNNIARPVNAWPSNAREARIHREAQE